MHILVVSQHYYPDRFRINDICKGLVKRGHSVDVITSLPDYSTSHIPSEYKHGKRRDEIFDGVHVHRVPTLERGEGAFKRFFNYSSFAFSGWFYATFWQREFDVALVYQTSPVTMVIPALEACKKFCRKMIIYCCDVWPESAKAMDLHKFPFMYNIVHKISKEIYNKSDMIAVTSKPFINYLSNVNEVSQERLTYIPQHGEDMLKTMSPSSDSDKEYYNFLFAGNIGSVQNVDCIVHAADKMRDVAGVRIHIVGDGSKFREIEGLVESLDLGHMVILHGRHSVESMVRFYQMADCFVLTLTGDNFIGMTLPAKLQSYMSMGKPVVVSANGASREIVRDVDCGVCAETGDAEELMRAMMEILENRELYAKKGRNARKYYEENFTLKRFLDNLEIELYKLTPKSPQPERA